MFGEPRGGLLSRLFGPTAPLWGLCWKFITPAVGLVVMVFTMMRNELTVEHRSEIYRFPQWAVPLSSLFDIQPSLVSFKRIIGEAEYGIKPRDYGSKSEDSFTDPSSSISAASRTTSFERSS
ncbi:hypothetical protein TELCIR_11492 [Teladorsagia circumcincta]|uniref:Uncharacterized protein n=1 Tax=Teladorsagia circumcincta TaxID=45464 RepID=A0A2G9UBA5_TELCI|nr:hypothetical protein TELCIR_11492 [Teladorsagia circumcincta]